VTAHPTVVRERGGGGGGGPSPSPSETSAKSSYDRVRRARLPFAALTNLGCTPCIRPSREILIFAISNKQVYKIAIRPTFHRPSWTHNS
jgi:hypothetical protein